MDAARNSRRTVKNTRGAYTQRSNRLARRQRERESEREREREWERERERDAAGELGGGGSLAGRLVRHEAHVGCINWCAINTSPNYSRWFALRHPRHVTLCSTHLSIGVYALSLSVSRFFSLSALLGYLPPLVPSLSSVAATLYGCTCTHEHTQMHANIPTHECVRKNLPVRVGQFRYEENNFSAVCLYIYFTTLNHSILCLLL